MMFGCQLACDSIAARTRRTSRRPLAASGVRTRWRESTRYQAMAVPARPSVTSTTNETAGPKSSVTGTIGMPSASTAVLAIRLTPSG